MQLASLAALDLADKINQFGAYAGLAAIVGLGVLSLLYFSQAREIKRLRDWAGRAPERAAELEAAASQAARQRAAGAAPPRLATHPEAGAAQPPRPASATVSPAQPLSAAGAAVAAGAAKPAGPAQPVPPAAPANAGQETVVARPGPPPADAGQETVVARPTPSAPGAQGGRATSPPGAGSGPDGRPAPSPSAPGPAASPPRAPVPASPTPGARPTSPPAAPLRNPAPLSYQPQSSRSRAEAQRDLGVEGRSPLRTTLMVVGGIVGVALVVFLLVTQVFSSSGGGSATGTGNTVAPVRTEPRTTARQTTTAQTAEPKVVRGDTNVVVLNGTRTNGLAAAQATKLKNAGFTKAMGATNTGNQAVTTSTVYFASGKRAAADAVARVLGISAAAVQAIDANTKAVAATAATAANVAAPDVVVVVGSDRAGA